MCNLSLVKTYAEHIAQNDLNNVNEKSIMKNEKKNYFKLKFQKLIVKQRTQYYVKIGYKIKHVRCYKIKFSLNICLLIYFSSLHMHLRHSYNHFNIHLEEHPNKMNIQKHSTAQQYHLKIYV